MDCLSFLMMPSKEINFQDELCKRFILDACAHLPKDLQGNLVDWLLTLDFDQELTKECFSTLLNRRVQKGEIKYEAAIKLALHAKKKGDDFYFSGDTIPLIFLATLCVDSRAVTITILDEQLTQLFEEVVNDSLFNYKNFLTIVQTFKEEGHRPKIMNARFDALLKRYAKEPEWKETLAEDEDHKVLHGFLNQF